MEPSRLRRLGLGRGPVVSPPPAGVVRAQTHEPIRIVDTRPPGTRSEPAPGVIVYDIGQNLTGWAEIRVKRPRGHRRRDLLLGEDRRRRQGQHRRQRPRLRPAADRLLRGEGRRRRALGAALQLQGLPVRAAQRSERRAARPATSRSRSSAFEQVRSDLARDLDLRVEQRDAQPDPPQHRVGDPEQPARHHHRHPGLREERLDGRRAAHRGHRLAPVRHRAALPEDVPGHARRADRAGRSAAPGAEQPELRLRGQAGVQAGRLLRSDPGLGRVLVRHPVGELRALRQPGGARDDLPRDAEVPGPLDTAMDRQGRRRLRPHPDRGPRRLGAARRAFPPSTRSSPPRTTRTSRASRRDVARALGKTEDAARYDRLVREHPRRLQRAVPLARRRLSRKGRRRRSSRPRRSCPWRSASCPTTGARRSRPGSRTTS